MNVFVYNLAEASVDDSPDITPEKLVIEDNVGEGIHIHLRNLRLDMSIDDYNTFADHLVSARENLNNGNR